ncbi:hypothetical protein ACHAWX_003364 [Stephanocyclus meneghinianus]
MTTSSPSPQWIAALSVVYVAIRVSAANLSPIMDCDEVFNYWEPLHFVLYGTGMQTWEYAPQYALRTYAYLLPMAAVAQSYRFLLDRLPLSIVESLSKLLLQGAAIPSSLPPSDNKPLLFAMLRGTLALVSSLAELSFLRAVRDEISPRVARWTAFLQLTAAGNFHACAAYLPSSTVMTLWQLGAANQFRDKHGRAVVWGLVAVLAAGWPFCAVLFVSTGVGALWTAYHGDDANIASEETTSGRRVAPPSARSTPVSAVANVLIQTVLHAAWIQAVVMAVDRRHYGKMVSPAWNIFAYNARAGGDELYGVEPLSYYVKNLALNFNFAAALGLFSLPILAFRLLFRKLCNNRHELAEAARRADSLKILGLVPMYIWLAVVLPRPHKEERFLFPIYPMISFGAAIAMDEILSASAFLVPAFASKKREERGRLESDYRFIAGLLAFCPSAIVSVSRSMALHHHYHAPLDLYQRLFAHSSQVPPPSGGRDKHYVCTGGEWYRFPSSFFLPSTAQLGFLKSSFGGQLPQPFTPYGSKAQSLDVQSGRFNDVNREEMDRYLSIEDCTYVIEMVSPGSSAHSDEMPECLQYMATDTAGSWSLLSSFRYLDAESTPALHRILYLPFGRENNVVYKEYNLYFKSHSVDR